MAKDIIKKTETAVQIFTDSEFMGAADEVSSSDVQIPSLMLMQAASDMVKDRTTDYKVGDLVSSISGDVIGNEDKPIELVVCDMFKTQVWYEGKNWVQTLEWEPSMEKDAYMSLIDGKEIKKQKCYNYVVFQADSVNTVDLPDGVRHVASPMVVKLKGGSAKYGKKFNSLLKDYASFGYPSWFRTFMLTTKEDTNNNGDSYNVLDFQKGNATTKEQQLAAAAACKSIREARANNEVNVVDTEEKTVKTDKAYNYAPGADNSGVNI